MKEVIDLSWFYAQSCHHYQINNGAGASLQAHSFSFTAIFSFMKEKGIFTIALSHCQAVLILLSILKISASAFNGYGKAGWVSV